MERISRKVCNWPGLDYEPIAAANAVQGVPRTVIGSQAPFLKFSPLESFQEYNRKDLSPEVSGSSLREKATQKHGYGKKLGNEWGRRPMKM